MKKLTQEGFISKAKDVHGDKYDYSIVKYNDNRTKVKIICLAHAEFEQRPDGHLQGFGCPICGGSKKLTSEIFINKATCVHKHKYDYSKVNYINNRTKIEIICPTHGCFNQIPTNHLQGEGCFNCANTENHIKQQLTTKEFIENSNKTHGYKYDYSQVIYVGNKKRVVILCPIHGKFKQTPSNHSNHKQGCPICKESKGEREIRRYLTENKINFLPQHKFNDCKYKKELLFDFYLPDYNICVEYNGEQHYVANNRLGGEKKLKLIQIRDNIKICYCKNNKITLLVIKYNQNIISVLTAYFKNLNNHLSDV